MFEVILDALIALVSAYIAWRFFIIYRLRQSARTLMMFLVFLVIAVSHTIEVLFLRLFKITTWLWLADETMKTFVLLLAIVGTAAALFGRGWRGSLIEQPIDVQDDR